MKDAEDDEDEEDAVAEELGEYLFQRIRPMSRSLPYTDKSDDEEEEDAGRDLASALAAGGN